MGVGSPTFPPHDLLLGIVKPVFPLPFKITLMVWGEAWVTGILEGHLPAPPNHARRGWSRVGLRGVGGGPCSFSLAEKRNKNHRHEQNQEEREYHT